MSCQQDQDDALSQKHLCPFVEEFSSSPPSSHSFDFDLLTNHFPTTGTTIRLFDHRGKAKIVTAAEGVNTCHHNISLQGSMKLFLFSGATATLLLLSLSTFVVDVVDAQGGRPDWAGQGGNKGNNGNGGQGQGRPNGGGGGQGQGGLFKGFENNNKNNGNKFGFKNIGKLLVDDIAATSCDELQDDYEELNPETTISTEPRRKINKQRKAIRTTYCLLGCPSPFGEIECDVDFAQGFCNKMVKQITRAEKKAVLFERKAGKTNLPAQVQEKFGDRHNMMLVTLGELTAQLDELQDLDICVEGVASPGN